MLMNDGILYVARLFVAKFFIYPIKSLDSVGNFYRLAINRRLPVTEAEKTIRLGDQFRIYSSFLFIFIVRVVFQIV